MAQWPCHTTCQEMDLSVEWEKLQIWSGYERFLVW
jgi:hypothetical protein